MRDIGLLIWVVFLVVGVMGSMVSSIRKQMAAGQRPSPQRPQAPQTPQRQQQVPMGQPQRPPQVPLGQPQTSLPPGVQEMLTQALRARIEPSSAPAPRPRPAPPPPAPAPKAAEPVHRPAETPRVGGVRRLFGSGPELVRAVIAAEVLGKPRGLNSEYPWG